VDACHLYPARRGHLWRTRKSSLPSAARLTFPSDTSQPYHRRHPASAPIHPSPEHMIKQSNNQIMKPQETHAMHQSHQPTFWTRPVMATNRLLICRTRSKLRVLILDVSLSKAGWASCSSVFACEWSEGHREREV